MYSVHLVLSRMIHDFQCIAETLNRQCPAYEMKTPNRGNGDKRRMGKQGNRGQRRAPWDVVYMNFGLKFVMAEDGRLGALCR